MNGVLGPQPRQDVEVVLPGEEGCVARVDRIGRLDLDRLIDPLVVRHGLSVLCSRMPDPSAPTESSDPTNSTNPNSTPDTDYTGYNFWLNKLTQFNGDYIAAEMVKAFISSKEYRQRFGP